MRASAVPVNETPLFACERAVFLDMEWTAWPGSMAREWRGDGEHREIVQMGLVGIDVAGGMVETGSLDLLIRPRINSVLSDYFVELSGITQQRLDREGMDIAEALERAAAFVAGDEVYSNGRDAQILAENCALYGIKFPFENNRFVNLRPIIAEAVGLPPTDIVSGDLPEILGFDANGRRHDAVADARAVAGAVRLLRADRLI